MNTRTQEDYERPGVLYGYRAVSDYGSFADGLGHVYYFGRSKKRYAIEAANVEEQKMVLKRKIKRRGLNLPSRILLWCIVPNVDHAWDELKEALVWSRKSTNWSPEITQQCVLGDHWFTVGNMGPEDFGAWCKEITRLV